MASKNSREIPKSACPATSVGFPLPLKSFVHDVQIRNGLTFDSRLIMDGPLLLTRVVRKAVVSFDTINAHGDAAAVQVDCLAPELTPRPLIGILCNDLLVLCRDPSDGQDPTHQVDLWAVLRMQTLPQPASIVHGNGECSVDMLWKLEVNSLGDIALRLVDNKAILYFDAPSPSDALNWYRGELVHFKIHRNAHHLYTAINLHIPASKT